MALVPAGSPEHSADPAEAPSRAADTAETGSFAADPTEAGSADGDSAAARAVAASSATTATAGWRPGRERFGSDAASSSIAAAQRLPVHGRRPGAVPVWDPPPPPGPKEGLWTRLGFGRKAERPEGNVAAPPAQQPRVPSHSSRRQPHPVGECAGTQTRPSAPAGQQPGTPVQPRPTPGAQPGGPSWGEPAGPGAAAAAGCGGRRHDPGPSAGAGRTAWRATPGARPPWRAPGRTPAGPGRTSWFPGRPSFRTAGARACRTGRSCHEDARAADAATGSGCNPGSGANPGLEPEPKDTLRNQRVGAGAEALGPDDHHAAKPKVGVARRTRKARLRLSRLDPWSVMKTSFLFSIAAGIMLVAAVYSLWTVLSTSGLFDSVNEIVRSVVSTPGDTTPFRLQEYINTQKVMGVTALIACVDVVIFTALATLGSFLYNLAATMLGGLEITLAED